MGRARGSSSSAKKCRHHRHRADRQLRGAAAVQRRARYRHFHLGLSLRPGPGVQSSAGLISSEIGGRGPPPGISMDKRSRTGDFQGPDAAHCGHRRDRLVHAESGFHDHRHGPPGHGAQLPCRPAAYERGAHLLSHQPVGVHSRQRLGGGPFRRAPGVPRRHRHLHPGLGAVRHRPQPVHFGAGAHPAGHRRRHDAPGRTAGAAALGLAVADDCGDVLGHHAGPGRPDSRTAARRLHRHVFFLALGVRHQRAHRRARRHRGEPVHHRCARGRSRRQARSSRACCSPASPWRR